MSTASAYQGPTCNWCGTALTRQQAATIQSCQAPSCETQRIVMLARSETQRHRDDHDQLIKGIRSACAEALADAAQSTGTEPSDLQIAVVPYNGKSLTPLPPARRSSFEVHLQRIAEDGFAIEQPELHAATHVRNKIDLPEAGITDAACATCMGDCCKAGGPSWGFMDETTVCRFRLSHPEASIEDFCSYYLDQLPERSVEGNCVFQSATGCTLNRADRADLCNTFLCRGVNRILQDHAAKGARTTAIIAQHAGKARAIRLYEPDTDRLHGVVLPGSGS